MDLCPIIGRGRLSYERSEYLFKQATKTLDPRKRGYNPPTSCATAD